MSTPTEDGAANPTQRRGRIPADSFPNRLVLARRLAGMTIKEAAVASGLNYGSWSNWENGKRPADILDAVARISAALDVDHDWLLFGGGLASSQGAPVARRPAPSPVRTGNEDSLTYPRQAVRPAAHRPKGRQDRNRPMVLAGVDQSARRPVRIGTNRAAGQAPEVINLG